MKIDNSDIFCRNFDQPFNEIDDEIVMLNIKKGEYYNFNSVASFIWNHFSQPKSLDSLLELLKRQYQVSPDECERDTKLFIIELINKGLLVVIEKNR